MTTKPGVGWIRIQIGILNYSKLKYSCTDYSKENYILVRKMKNYNNNLRIHRIYQIIV